MIEALMRRRQNFGPTFALIKQVDRFTYLTTIQVVE
jgi:hypothetical protein